jgi:hypothetical protein
MNEERHGFQVPSKDLKEKQIVPHPGWQLFCQQFSATPTSKEPVMLSTPQVLERLNAIVESGTMETEIFQAMNANNFQYETLSDSALFWKLFPL